MKEIKLNNILPTGREQKHMNQEVYGVIYMALCTKNNKKYIGQTTEGLKKRRQQHLSGRKRLNTYFHKALNKYPQELWKWEILSTCYTKEDLDFEEIFFIEKFITLNQNFGYNLKSGGSYGKHSEKTKKKISEANKGKKRSEETKKKISKSQQNMSEETKNKMSKAKQNMSEETKRKMSESCKGKFKGEKNPMYGKHHSEEAKNKISEGNRNKKMTEEAKNKISEGNRGKKRSEESKKKYSEAKKGKKRSEETKKKISKSMKGSKHPRARKVKCIETEEVFNTVKEASISKSTNQNSIYMVCKGEYKSAGKLHWEYVA